MAKIFQLDSSLLRSLTEICPRNAAGQSERRAKASRHRLTQMRLPLDGFTRRTRLGIRISRDLCIELVKTESTKPRKQMRIEYLSDFLLSICFYFDSDRCKIAKMLLALPDFCFKWFWDEWLYKVFAFYLEFGAPFQHGMTWGDDKQLLWNQSHNIL